MIRRYWIVLAIAQSLSSPVRGEVVLVADRRAQCTIVLGKDSRGPMAHSFDEGRKTTRAVHVPVLRESAEDLAAHLNEIALIWEPNHKVRVVERKELVRTKYRVLLGSSAVEEHGLQEEAQSLSYPGYIYRTVGNDLLIFGSSPKGAANGIYGFLQDELGVRWFGPQELFRVLPEQKGISLGALDKRVEPSFPGRWYGVSGHQKHPAYRWARRRMRMAEMVDDGEPFANASHYLYRIFRPALYAEKHPDYYPLRNGRRLKPDVQNWTPCLTNPGVIQVATNAALGAFRNPVRHSFSLGINDTGVFCECEPCRKHSTGIEFRGRSDWQSDVYYWFVSQVARDVQKEHPGRYIGAIAYNNVTPPPKGAVAKNVHVVIVNDISEYFDRDYQKVDDELVQAWQAKGITLGLYYYMGLAKLVPAYFPRLIDRELKDKHRRGFTSMRCEVFPGWPWNGPQAYVAARLWWEVDLNVDDLLKDYFETLFGPAAEPMSRLYALFEETHLRPRRGGFLYEHYKFDQFRPYTGDDLAKMRTYLAQAHTAAPAKSDIAKRVGYVSNGLQVFLTMLEATDLARQFQKPVAYDNISASRRLEEIDRANAILANHDALYRETILNDSNQSRRYTRDTCVSTRNAWKRFVSSTVTEALIALEKWSAAGQPDARVRARLEETIARLTSDRYRKAMFQIKSGKAELGPNRVANPGFEQGDEGDRPKGPEWAPAQIQGWSLWPASSKPGLSLSTQDRHEGKRSARIASVREGVLISTVKGMTEGELYYVTFWAKCLPPKQGEVKSKVALTVQWLNEKGSWWRFGANTFRAKLQKVNEWEKLEAIAMVPKGPAGAALFLGASALDDGQAVYFDEVSVRKITLR